MDLLEWILLVVFLVAVAAAVAFAFVGPKARDATPEIAPVTMTATTITPRFRQKYPAVRLH